MKTIEIRDENEFERLRPEWDELLAASTSRTVFSTFDWASAWWSAYGVPGTLRILTAFDDEGRLRGIAPLRSRKLSQFGQSHTRLAFIGDGSGDSDYLDFIIARDHEKAVLASFWARWGDELRSGTVLSLSELPQSSGALCVLRAMAGADKSCLWTETPVSCGTARLPESWEEYLGVLRPRFRTKVRSVLRHLESRPEVRFGVCRDMEEARRMLPVLFDLHAKRWAQEGMPGVFGWDRKREFYFDLSARLLEKGQLRLSWLEWSGQILACQYGFVYDNTYFHLQEGYEPASEHWSVGIGLRAWSIREFLREGLREYDFLGGVGRHKLDWGAEVKYSSNVLLTAATFKNRLLCSSPEWKSRARERVKSLVPERILAAKQARLTRRPEADGNPVSGTGERLRQAVAKCYFHLGLPALTRHFRDRYQLAVSPNGSGRRFGCEKRSAAAGRILYYHRVNDDRDPFCPATPTRLFEQEMCFLAKHHRVVSLGELLDHLDNDSPKPVVSITFDDGYQDNYQNAFPILQRYGMPATIFLTTGGIDSHQPLWFEQLAGALKKTSREFVDLEIDLPRRFWSRNVAEKLNANNQIFALLRRLSDSDRRQWLARILERLTVPKDAEREGKMLTWDQIREMRGRGIEFGGHTVNHPFLSQLTRKQAVWEVSECKRRIEEEVQQRVDYFAYPNGRGEDFAEWNKQVLAAAGYRAAVTTIWGMNHRATDRMALRRGQPWEGDEALFAGKLDWYQLTNG